MTALAIDISKSDVRTVKTFSFLELGNESPGTVSLVN